MIPATGKEPEKLCLFQLKIHIFKIDSSVRKQIMHIHMTDWVRVGFQVLWLGVEEVAKMQFSSAVLHFSAGRKTRISYIYNKCSLGTKLWNLFAFLDHSIWLLMQIYELALISLKTTRKDWYWLDELNHNRQKV